MGEEVQRERRTDRDTVREATRASWQGLPFRERAKKDAAGDLCTSTWPLSRDGTPGKRDRKELYPEVAEELCQYLDLRATRISRDKCGVDYFKLYDRTGKQC